MTEQGFPTSGVEKALRRAALGLRRAGADILVPSRSLDEADQRMPEFQESHSCHHSRP